MKAGIEIGVRFFKCLITARKRSFRKEMFSVVCVRLSTGGEGRMYVTITYDTLDLTFHPPAPDIRPWTPPSTGPVPTPPATDV